MSFSKTPSPPLSWWRQDENIKLKKQRKQTKHKNIDENDTGEFFLFDIDELGDL